VKGEGAFRDFADQRGKKWPRKEKEEKRNPCRKKRRKPAPWLSRGAFTLGEHGSRRQRNRREGGDV